MRNTWSAPYSVPRATSTHRAGRTIVHERRDDLGLRPLRFCVELLRESVPATLVRGRDLGQIIVENGLMEVNNELWAAFVHKPGHSRGRERAGTHALDHIWDLRERGLLDHLLLDGEQSRLVYHRLRCARAPQPASRPTCAARRGGAPCS
jgi:hypothetical protein